MNEHRERAPRAGHDGGLVRSRAVAAQTPGHSAARRGRVSIEEALLAVPRLPPSFPREDLRDRLLKAVQCLYETHDAEVIALAHLDGLSEAAAMARESRAILESTGDPAATEPLAKAIAHLTEAEAVLQQGAAAVRAIHLERRAEIITGGAPGPVPSRPLCAGAGVPELHAPPRLRLLPQVHIEPEAPPPDRGAPSARLTPPRTLEELSAFATDALSGALAQRFTGVDEAPEPPAPAVEAPYQPFEPAVEELQVLRDLARDCLEDVAAGRSLRQTNALESWLDQGPFEQRLIENLDAFAALGGGVLPRVSLFHAEAKIPDPERAFAVALTLGSIEGPDTVDAAVMILKQSAPEEHAGWFDGLWLAPNPAIDTAMADLATHPRSALAALALDVLHARGRTPDEVVRALLDHDDPGIAVRIARALATALPRRDAVDRLELLCATTPDDDLFLAALESLLRRGDERALPLLRDAVDAPESVARCRRALPLLCLAGRAGDLDRLLGGLHEGPTVRLLRGLGRFGHVESLGVLQNYLEHEDADVVAAAAEALDRITGAGLREAVEEPWEVELPPEAANAGGIAVPLRKVERIVLDPARWSAWLRDNTRRLDQKKLKTRGGVPFSPAQIVDELEARATPPQRREEAALELVLCTGLVSAFSPHDWVARQKQHLAELRAEVASLPFSPGAWTIAARRPVEEEPPAQPAAVEEPDHTLVTPAHAVAIPSYLAVERAPAALSGTSMGFTAPGRFDETRVLPALSRELVAQLTKGALPFAEGKPGAAQPSSEQDQGAGPARDAAREPSEGRSAIPMPDETLPTTPSPFARPVLEGRLAIPMPDETLRTTPSPLARPVLPFSSGAPAASRPMSTASAPARRDEGEIPKVDLPDEAARPVLPFVPSVTIPGAPPVRSSALVGGTMALPRELVEAARNLAVLPFQGAAPPAEVESPTSSGPTTAPVPPRPTADALPFRPATSGEPAAPAAPLPTLTLQQYASLCAELAVFPDRTEAVFLRYKLGNLRDRLAVDLSWQERLRRNPDEHQGWQKLYLRWVEHFERVKAGSDA